MNRRINKILLDILHEKEDSLANYAKLFDVSEQTIRNDIKVIMETKQSIWRMVFYKYRRRLI